MITGDNLNNPAASTTDDIYFDFGFTEEYAVPEAYYFFGRDGTTATTLRAFKATDPSTSWTAGATSTGFTTAILGLAGYQVGSTIYLALYDGTSPTLVATKFVTYDMLTDTFGTIETVKAAASIISAPTTLGLVARSNGEAVVFFSGVGIKVASTTYARVYYTRRTAVNTWSAAVEVDSNASSNMIGPIAVLGQTDRVHFGWSVAGGSVGYRTLSAANALNTGGTSASMPTPSDGCGYDRAGTFKVVFTGAGSGQTTMYFNSADNPTPTFANQSIANARDPHRIGSDPFDNSVTIVYSNSADSDLYAIKSTNDGATFGAPVSLFVGTVGATDLTLSRSATGSNYDRDANTVVGYIVNDGGTWKYNEYIVRQLGASGTGTLTNADGSVVAGSGAVTTPDRGTLASGVSTVAGSGAAIGTGTGTLAAVSATGQRGAGISASIGAGVPVSVSTNLIAWSEQFEQATWSKSGATVSIDATVAPDSTTTADLITADGSFGIWHQVSLAGTVKIPATDLYTQSVYIKAGTGRWVRSSNAGGEIYVNFDVIDGVVGFSGTLAINPVITPVGNGWFRCSVSFNAVLNNNLVSTFNIIDQNYNGATVGFNSCNQTHSFWGAQVNPGALQPYVKTTSAPVSGGSYTTASLVGTGTAAWRATGALAASLSTLAGAGTAISAAAIGTGVLTAVNTTGQRGAGVSGSTNPSGSISVPDLVIDGVGNVFTFGAVNYGHKAEGQAFVSGGTSVTKISAMLVKYGVPSDGLRIKISTTDSNQLPVALIGTSNITPASSVPLNTEGRVEFTFTPPLAVNDGQLYHVAIDRAGAADDDNIYGAILTDARVYAGLWSYQRTDTLVWITDANPNLVLTISQTTGAPVLPLQPASSMLAGVGTARDVITGTGMLPRVSALTADQTSITADSTALTADATSIGALNYATIVGRVASTTGTGALIAATPTLVGVGAVGGTASGVLVSTAATLSAVGKSETRGTAVLSATTASLTASGIAGLSNLRPNGDVAPGGWTDQAGGSSNIYQSIDETVASDVDFIQSPGIADGGTPTRMVTSFTSGEGGERQDHFGAIGIKFNPTINMTVSKLGFRCGESPHRCPHRPPPQNFRWRCVDGAKDGEHRPDQRHDGRVLLRRHRAD